MYDLHVASLTKKMIRGRPYYYLRECQRVNGKPKIVWQRYLGPADEVVRRLAEPPVPESAHIVEFGASAAAFDITRRLELVEIVDRHVAKRPSRAPTVGQYLQLAALNRCVAPCSKARVAGWYQQTALPRLLGHTASQLTSQRFWDNMTRVDADAIVAIERDLAAKAVREFGLDLRCVLFDCTNFFSFIDSFNAHAELAQRGHSKEGRDNLRIVGLALLVTADGEIPLMHQTYPGNQHDATTFRSISEELAARCKSLAAGACDITVVFDKGNNSESNLESVAQGGYHFVGSLVPTQHPELLQIERKKMKRLDKTQLPAVWSYRTRKKVFDAERTVLVTYNEPLFVAQTKTLRREIAKRRRKLIAIVDSLERWAAGEHRGKQPTVAGVRKRVDALLRARHMKELFQADVDAGAKNLPVLCWRFRDEAWKQLQKTLLGKTILFTDHDAWTDEQIVLGYRSQHHVEAAFRAMKDPRCLTFRPAHHWTDQKLRVHALYCVVALMIASLLRRQLAKAGIRVSLAAMIEQLSKIREVSYLMPGDRGESPRVRTVLSTLDERQRRMLDTLALAPLRAA